LGKQCLFYDDAADDKDIFEFFTEIYSLHMKNVQGLRSSAGRAVPLARLRGEVLMCERYRRIIHLMRLKNAFIITEIGVVA
jgi:hypothetical protein